jgi:hypothetical protein
LIAANEADTVSVVSVSLASIASDISDGRRSSANRDSVNQQNAAKKKK